MIIHIKGVQGSGKTYLCTQIKNIKCVDLDDVMRQTLDIMDSDEKIPKTDKQYEKISNNIVKDYIKNNEKIIFVGMTVQVPNPDVKFYIRLTDLDKTYRRLILRELQQIIKNKDKIIKHVKTEKDPKDIYVSRVAGLGTNVETTYEKYRYMYKESMKRAKSKGYKPKTQDQILEFIEKLDKN